MRIRLLLPILLLFSTVMIQAQNTIVTNLYFKNMNYLNPAAGIETDETKYQFQFYGKYKHVENELWSNSLDLYFNHIGKIEKISGFYNISYLFDRYSYFSRQSLLAGYTQVWNWGNHHYFNIGARGAFFFDQVDWTKLPYIDSHDHDRFYFNPDLDLGIRYGNKKLAVGFSVKNIFSTTVCIDEQPFIKNQRFWIVDALYQFDIKEIVSITPYTAVSYERKVAFDLGVNVGYKEIVSIGYVLRALELRHIYSILGNVGNHFHIGFAVDHSSLHSDINFDIVLRGAF